MFRPAQWKMSKRKRRKMCCAFPPPSRKIKQKESFFSRFILPILVCCFSAKKEKRRTRICVYKCVCLFQDEQQINLRRQKRREEDGYRLLDVSCVQVFAAVSQGWQPAPGCDIIRLHTRISHKPAHKRAKGNTFQCAYRQTLTHTYRYRERQEKYDGGDTDIRQGQISIYNMPNKSL